MKKVWCILVLTSACMVGVAQNIFIANSNPGASGGIRVYTGESAIADALVAASSGDIIYVVPSNVVYQSPFITKSISIIGTGFNQDAETGASPKTLAVYVDADNVRLAGLVMDQVNYSGSHSNFIVDKCRTGAIQTSPGSSIANLIIQNCIIGEGFRPSYPLYLEGASSVKVSNNIIYTNVYAMRRLDAVILENNLIIGSINNFYETTNCNIKNNIFYFANLDAEPSVGNNQFQNNLSYGGSNTVFPASNGNTSVNNIQDQDPMFVNFPPPDVTFDFSLDVHLQAGSPAIGTGLAGTDMGVFGGSNPFDIYGAPLPVVRDVLAPNTVSQGSNLNVRIKAKGN